MSYFLAREGKRLGLPSIAALPKCQMVLEPATFNKIHRAIEKHGTAKQKKRLYQLAWYEYGAFNSEDLTVITVSQQRLLLPKALVNFLPKQYKKFMGLFTNNAQHLEFLEAQQALLAQLALSLNFDTLPLASVSITHPTLRSLTTRYQLLQQALQSVEQPPIRWWQWQQERWKKAWQEWLVEQLQKNQASLSDCLANFYQQVQSRKDLLSQATYREKVQPIIQSVQALIDNDPREHQNISLTVILKRLSTRL